MAKALRSFPKEQRGPIANKRFASQTKGLGYWGAHDFLYPEIKIKKPKKK